MTEWYPECDRYRTCAECPRRDLCDAEEQAEKLLAAEQAKEQALVERVTQLEKDVEALWDWFRRTEDRNDRMIAAVVKAAQDERED